MIRQHSLHHAHGHLGWSRDEAPRLRIAPGDSVELDCIDAGAGQLNPDSTAADIPSMDPARANPLTGPIAVDGAEPGDALRIEFLGYAHEGWGWTGILPGFGLLADQFPDPWLHISCLQDQHLNFCAGLRLPLRPFCGTVGVAPAARGRHSVIPPRRVGGNLDCRALVEGAQLWLPVEVPEALLSIGDTHAAQGDGEVCGTAVEAPMRVQLRVHLEKQAAPDFPLIEAPGDTLQRTPGRVWITTGVGPDLMQASRDAVSAMIERLCSRTRLDPPSAYALCSVAGDLHISELVDAPNWVVALHLPAAILQ